jgi:hypothetical protein
MDGRTMSVYQTAYVETECSTMEQCRCHIGGRHVQVETGKPGYVWMFVPMTGVQEMCAYNCPGEMMM